MVSHQDSRPKRFDLKHSIISNGLQKSRPEESIIVRLNSVGYVVKVLLL